MEAFVSKLKQVFTSLSSAVVQEKKALPDRNESGSTDSKYANVDTFTMGRKDMDVKARYMPHW